MSYAFLAVVCPVTFVLLAMGFVHVCFAYCFSAGYVRGVSVCDCARGVSCVTEVVCVFGGLSYAYEGRHVDCVVVLAMGVSWSVHAFLDGYCVVLSVLYMICWSMVVICGVCFVFLCVFCCAMRCAMCSSVFCVVLYVI
ncbi:Beta-Secretase 1, partial [Manis pentadactyla]